MRGRGGDRPAHGWSVIEALVVVAVIGIVLAVALPAYGAWVQRERLRGAAVVLQQHLRLMQSEGHKRQVSVAVRFQRHDDGGWCYGWALHTPCDCGTADQCVVDGTSTVVSSKDWPDIQLIPGVVGSAFIFHPRRGTVNAGNVTLENETGQQLRVVVSGMGRLRLCAPGDAFFGYPPCS